MSDAVALPMSPLTTGTVRHRTPSHKLRPYVQVLVVMAVLTLFPHIGLDQRYVHLGVVCLIWSMAAYGLFVPYAFAGQMTVAIVTAWGVGAFCTGIAITYWEWTFVPNLLFSIAAAFVACILMALPIFRTKGHYFVIVTFVIAQAVTVAANNWNVTAGDFGSGITIRDDIEFLGFNFAGRISVFYLSLAVVTLMALSAVFIRGSHFGRKLASIRENEDLARSIGIPTTRLKVTALGVGGIYAGIAGTFYIYYLNHIDIHGFGVPQAITLILILVVGGRTAILGPVAGAAVAYYLPEIINLDPRHVLIAYGLVLAVMVIVLPDGLLGSWSSISKARLARREARAALAASEGGES